jgi:hypothetical protein
VTDRKAVIETSPGAIGSRESRAGDALRPPPCSLFVERQCPGSRGAAET